MFLVKFNKIGTYWKQFKKPSVVNWKEKKKHIFKSVWNARCFKKIVFSFKEISSFHVWFVFWIYVILKD